MKLKARSLCVGPLPDVIDLVTLPLVFPARSVVRVDSLQPDPQPHSTAAHWGHILKLHPWSWGWTFSPSRTFRAISGEQLCHASLILRNPDVLETTGPGGQEGNSLLMGSQEPEHIEESPTPAGFQVCSTLKTLMRLRDRAPAS